MIGDCGCCRAAAVLNWPLAHARTARHRMVDVAVVRLAHKFEERLVASVIVVCGRRRHRRSRVVIIQIRIR